MTYRPIEFRVKNADGISCDISIDPESSAIGPEFFLISQDTGEITVTLECLEGLVACATELLDQRDAKQVT